jgi:hypothetical protein
VLRIDSGSSAGNNDTRIVQAFQPLIDASFVVAEL